MKQNKIIKLKSRINARKEEEKERNYKIDFQELIIITFT